MPELIIEKPKFTEYYSIPEFKEKHKQYMMTKVECICGRLVARANMSNHKKTEKHKRLVIENTDIVQKNLTKLIKAIDNFDGEDFMPIKKAAYFVKNDIKK